MPHLKKGATFSSLPIYKFCYFNICVKVFFHLTKLQQPMYNQLLILFLLLSLNKTIYKIIQEFNI